MLKLVDFGFVMPPNIDNYIQNTPEIYKIFGKNNNSALHCTKISVQMRRFAKSGVYSLPFSKIDCLIREFMNRNRAAVPGGIVEC